MAGAIATVRTLAMPPPSHNKLATKPQGHVAFVSAPIVPAFLSAAHPTTPAVSGASRSEAVMASHTVRSSPCWCSRVLAQDGEGAREVFQIALREDSEMVPAGPSQR